MMENGFKENSQISNHEHGNCIFFDKIVARQNLKLDLKKMVPVFLPTSLEVLLLADKY
jgi:hypothetical protein